MKTESTQNLRSQLAEYVAQQPASKQAFHKWMRIAELASLAIPVAVFAVALYLSFAWKSVPVKAIPTAWLCFPLSFAPFLILVGVHAIILRAFPPTGLLTRGTLQVYAPPAGQLVRTLQLRVGRKGVAWGWGVVVTALVVGAFWGAFAWAVWSYNPALTAAYIQILATLLGIMIAVSIVVSIVQKLLRSR
jgi:hypothetical protein